MKSIVKSVKGPRRADSKPRAQYGLCLTGLIRRHVSQLSV